MNFILGNYNFLADEENLFSKYNNELILLKLYISGDELVEEDYSALREKYIGKIMNNNSNLFSNEFADSGFDLYIPEEIDTETATAQIAINFRVRCAAFRMKHESNEVQLTPTGFFAMPRSSISNTHLRMANSVGLID